MDDGCVHCRCVGYNNKKKRNTKMLKLVGGVAVSQVICFENRGY